MDVRATLGKISLFADVLPPEELDHLAARCHVVDYEPGTVLMSEGDFGTFMVAILWGRLEVSVAGTRHATREVAVLGPGDIVGEMSLLTGARRSATVTAAKKISALEIPKTALEGLIVESPGLIARFAEMIEQRHAELSRIHDDAGRWNHGGLSRDEIVARMTAFFAG